MTSKKKIFVFGWRLLEGTSQVGVFFQFFGHLYTWPWAPTHWPIILAQVFFGN